MIMMYFHCHNDVIFKIGKFKEEIRQASQVIYPAFADKLISRNPNINLHQLHPKGYDQALRAWFNEGIDCEILTLGSQTWKKGKVRIKISVEFDIEDDVNTTNSQNSEIIQPESPLEDLRRMISEAINP